MKNRLWMNGWLASALAVVLAACGSGGGTNLMKDVGDLAQDVRGEAPQDQVQGEAADAFAEAGPDQDIPWKPEAGETEAGVEEPWTGWDVEVTPDADVFVPDGAGLCDEEGGFGCPCVTNSECNSGWCVETPGGYMCSMLCVDECPEGWHCAMVQDFPDVVTACLPSHPKLCRPCLKDQECMGIVIGTQVLCVDLGPAGSYCGGDCSDKGTPCPDGFECLNVASIEGEEGLQCVPESGECSCSPLAVELKLSTGCYVENEFGKCVGERVCDKNGLSDCDAKEPGPEICNGKDDDCNGVADDDLIQEECEIENPFGACKGKVLCVGGIPVCQGKEPTAELCDGLDNNCDGTADEGYNDCDKDGLADCIEPDDDADGWPDGADNCQCAANPTQTNFDADGLGDACDPDDDNDTVLDEQDCAPTNPKVYPGVMETCDGVDNDCDKLVDEGSLDTDQDGVADCTDLDDDDDTLPDTFDNCPLFANPDQKDTDFDKQGDPCDPDADGDGYPKDTDCDPLDKNVFPNAPELCDCKDNNCNGQGDENYPDTDKDGTADCCEDDPDGDGKPNALDNCDFVPNPDQLNTDGDLDGDECDQDDDNDGVIDAVDCAPKQVKAFPNAPEICDGVDNDCDGTIDNNFPDQDKDGQANCVDVDDDGDGKGDLVDKCPFVPDPLQIDTDKDGFGDACDGDDDGDGDFDLTDCAPLDPLINHATLELCNGADDNCDKIADNPGAVGCIPLFPDGDGDGFGALGEELCLCVPEPPYTAFQGGDCDDADPLINPVAAEVCNTKDDNCDGKIDPAGAGGCTKYYQDADGDGVGVAGPTQCLCKPQSPYTSTKPGDCAANDPVMFPGNVEVCDGKDNDCNGSADDVDAQHCTKFYKDLDKDGFGDDTKTICACEGDPAAGYTVTKGGDCNDASPKINPSVAEACGDGVDNNCNGKKEENCVPSKIDCLFVAAGAHGKGGGTLKVTSTLGIPAGAQLLDDGDAFMLELGLLPTSVTNP